MAIYFPIISRGSSCRPSSSRTRITRVGNPSTGSSQINVCMKEKEPISKEVKKLRIPAKVARVNGTSVTQKIKKNVMRGALAILFEYLLYFDASTNLINNIYKNPIGIFVSIYIIFVIGGGIRCRCLVF